MPSHVEEVIQYLYRRWEAERILSSIVQDYEFAPYFQEFAFDSPWNRLLSRIIQPTRLLYRFGRPA